MAGPYLPLHDGVSSSPCTKQCYKRAFRIITIHRGAKDSEIVCELEHTFIEEARHSYEALSYTWGGLQASEFVILNGYHVPVTKSLFEALSRLRVESSDRRLWIDALCINQQDLPELSIQVERMGDIYKGASKVIVFLGLEADDSAVAMILLGRISDLALGDHMAMKDMLDTPLSMRNLQALLILFERPWWTRAWIVQEYSVADNVNFVCGNMELVGHKFERALENLVDYRFKAVVAKEHESIIRRVAKTTIHHLYSTRRVTQEGGITCKSPVLSILYKFRGSKCSDARDKVFSIWNLIESDALLTPDYSKDTNHVYQAVVRASIESSGTLEVLAHHNRSVESVLNLPTWCPDWTVMRGKRILLWPNGYVACTKFHQALVKIENNVLTLQGREIARVEQLHSFESDDFKDLCFIRQELSNLESLAVQCSYQENESAYRLSAFRQTIVAGRVRPSGPQGKMVRISGNVADKMWTAWWSKSEHVKYSDRRDAKAYNEALYGAMCGRSFFLTTSGRPGLVDNGARPGDRVFIFAGGQVPFCVRDRSEKGANTFEFVGECYIHGYMEESDADILSCSEEMKSVALV